MAKLEGEAGDEGLVEGELEEELFCGVAQACEHTIKARHAFITLVPIRSISFNNSLTRSPVSPDFDICFFRYRQFYLLQVLLCASLKPIELPITLCVLVTWTILPQ